jgi:hypothetical protein
MSKTFLYAWCQHVIPLEPFFFGECLGCPLHLGKQGVLYTMALPLI